MDQTMTKSAFVPIGTHVLYGGDGDFRTRMVRYLMDPVLPVVTLLCISALTVAVIVLMVTAVATAFLRAQPEMGNVIDPWAGVSSSPAGLYEDDLASPGGTLAASQMDNGGLRLDSQPNDRCDPAPLARWTP